MAAQVVSSSLDLVLTNRRVINVTGADALAFLQAQLTADVAQVPEHEWRMAGYCSPKGRLLASGLLWRIEGGFAWLVAEDLAAALVKRLRMFVLRLKVSVEIREAAVIGRLGASVPSPQVAAEAQGDGVSFWLGLPDVLGSRRAFGVLEAEHLDTFLASAGSQAASTPGARSNWDWLEVRSGISFIESATQDRFVPQMVNLEALGGVDFKKGCYPGQEIVARSQYLGKLKRRTLLAHSSEDNELALPMAGGDVYGLDSHEPVGTVVSAARAPDGSIDCLIEAPLAAWPSGLALVAEQGRALEALEMPYVLPDNEVFVRPRALALSQAEGSRPGATSKAPDELYIYYKVASGQRDDAAQAVEHLLSATRVLGVTARLMRRRDVADDGTETWMEVYRDVPHDFERVLTQLADQAGVSGLIGQRRHEWFVAC